MRNVLLYGGIYHPFEESSQALAGIFAESNIETILTSDPIEAIAELDNADILTLNCLRWRMLEDEKYVPFRAQWAYEIPEAAAEKITDFVESGGALLALHTASICFDTWHSFGTLLGGRWHWGKTFHPPIGAIDVRPEQSAHPIVESLQPFSLTDEVYHHLDRDPQSQLLLQARCQAPENTSNVSTQQADWHAVAWAQEQGEGRVVYSALGHDAASIERPPHREFIGRSIEWLIGNLD